MRIPVMLWASAAGLLAGSALVDTALSQSAFRTCSEAYRACVSKTRLAKECAEENEWCRRTGTFADPVSKTVSSGLQKK
jgi:hypothetical protein